MQVETIQKYQSLALEHLDSLNVLLVDDEPAVVETLKLFLQNMGIGHIQTTNCGNNALDHLEKNHYDFIFMDLMMPGMNGIDVLKEIQQHHQLTSVIIMTGYPSMNVVINAMHNGAADFLVKPFNFKDIKIILERIQRLHLLREKNWQLRQELEEKRKVEELNLQLEKKIRLQTILFSIVNSLSEMNPSDIYNYLVERALESCNAKKSCFMIYDQEESKLVVLAQKGLNISPGIKARLKKGSNGNRIVNGNFIQTYFGKRIKKGIPLDAIHVHEDLMTVPFNIRNEPFGVLFVAEKEGDTLFDEEDEFIINFLSHKKALNIENIALYGNLKESFFASFMSLVSAIEAKFRSYQR